MLVLTPLACPRALDHGDFDNCSVDTRNYIISKAIFVFTNILQCVDDASKVRPDSNHFYCHITNPIPFVDIFSPLDTSCELITYQIFNKHHHYSSLWPGR